MFTSITFLKLVSVSIYFTKLFTLILSPHFTVIIIMQKKLLDNRNISILIVFNIKGVT